MKYTLLLLTLLLSTAQANLGTFKDGRLLNPDTNKPFTGNLDVINNDWGVNAIEFNKDYVDGVLHGIERSYYQSGKLRSEGEFVKGVVNGFVTGYYEDGTIKVRAFFDNGVKQGRVVYYYPDGSKQVEQFFGNDKLNGLVRTWYENGNLMKSEAYKDGMLHGTTRTYYETGELFEDIRYEFGKPKFMKMYREDGTLADERGFFDKEIIERIVG